MAEQYTLEEVADKIRCPMRIIPHHLDHPPHRLFIGDVAGDGHSLTAGLAQLLQGLLGWFEIVGGDSVTAFGQHQGDLPSDTSGSSGNEGDAILRGQKAAPTS